MSETKEENRLEALKRPGAREHRGGNGDPTSANGSGEQFERTTVRTEMSGTTSLMTRPDPAHIIGVKMVSPASAMTINYCALA